MNELTLTELDMGSDIPRILRASAPYVDHQGKREKISNKHSNTQWLFSVLSTSKI